MKICLDGFSISSLEGTGLHSYSHRLIEQLVEYYPQGEYHLMWDDSPKLKFDTLKEISFASLRVNRIKGEFTELENYIETNQIMLYHSPNNGLSLPSNKICRYVITVHDLITLINERYVDEAYKRKFFTFFPRAVESADKIIAVSNSIKKELLTYFSIPEEKIEVIYPTSTLHVSADKEVNIKNILKYKYHIKDPFVLYIGSIHQRKNLRTLLTSFKDIMKKHPEMKLVMVGKIDGKRTSYFNSLISLISILGIKDSVIFTGTVALNDMYYFYSQCSCFVNLSEYEGFPLTSLEAMQCGAPIMVSNIPSMKEVVGSGGLLIDQKNEREITENIFEILNDTKYREKLKASAKGQAKSFDAPLSVKKLISLYEGIT